MTVQKLQAELKPFCLEGKTLKYQKDLEFS